MNLLENNELTDIVIDVAYNEITITDGEKSLLFPRYLRYRPDMTREDLINGR